MSLFTNLQDPILSLYNYILRQIYILTCNIIHIEIESYVHKLVYEHIIFELDLFNS